MKAYQGVQQHNLSTFDVCNDDSKTCFWVEVVFFTFVSLFTYFGHHWCTVLQVGCFLSALASNSNSFLPPVKKTVPFFFAFCISNLPTSNAQTEEIVHMPFVVSNPDIVGHDCTDFVEFVSLWKLEVLEETLKIVFMRLCAVKDSRRLFSFCSRVTEE